MCGVQVRLTSANSVNIGRLLPQMVYYFHAVAQAARRVPARRSIVCTPSGNFGNLTAGLIAKRAGLPIATFVAATNVNDVVPGYLDNGLFAPRASVQTIANAMDVGQPEQLRAYALAVHDDLEAMRARHRRQPPQRRRRAGDDPMSYTSERGYLLDPHSAIAYHGLITYLHDPATRRHAGSGIGIFLATAHPAKFSEVVEPVLGRPVEMPAPLAEVLAQPRHVLKINATFDAVRRTLAS